MVYGAPFRSHTHKHTNVQVAALMDVGVKFHTSFGKVQDSVPAMERALAGLCNRIVASVDDHVVFDPDINAADDTTAVALTKT